LDFDVFFIPDFDSTKGYYDAAEAWWTYWGPMVDGLFSWESTWPVIDATDDGNITLDVTVMAGATAQNKPYMIGMSKDS
jgi:glucan endo-1,3-alpha-glucosidase